MTVKELLKFLESVPEDFIVKVNDAYQQEDFDIDETCIYVREKQKEIVF